MPYLNTIHQKPSIPVFPKESLPVPGKSADRGLSYLKAVVEVLGCKVEVGSDAPRICEKNKDGHWRLRPLRSIENACLGFTVVWDDTGEKDMLFSSPAREVSLLTDWILKRYNPDPNKVEYEYLQVINARFIYEHGPLNDEDINKIIEFQKLMATMRLGAQARLTPFPGDTLQGAYYDGKFPFNNGLIVQRPAYAEENDNKIHFCAGPYIPFITEKGHMDCSGGPWFSADKRHFTYAGEGERLFQFFGHDGPCANGAVTFPARSNNWHLSADAGI